MKTEQTVSIPRAVRAQNGRTNYYRLYMAIKTGSLKATQPGGKFKHYRVRLADVERFLTPTGAQ